jgi:hypothetical protein
MFVRKSRVHRVHSVLAVADEPLELGNVLHHQATVGRRLVTKSLAVQGHHGGGLAMQADDHTPADQERTPVVCGRRIVRGTPGQQLGKSLQTGNCRLVEYLDINRHA